MSIPTLLTTLRLLLAHPNADDGLAPEPTALYQRDLRGFERRARDHTAQHAMGEEGETTLPRGDMKTGEGKDTDEDKNEGVDEDEDSKMHVAGDDNDSTSSSSNLSDGQATDGGSRRSATASRASQATLRSHGPSSPSFPGQQQQHLQLQLHEEEEERGWDSDVSICGDDGGASSPSSSSTLSDDDDDESISPNNSLGHGQGSWRGANGREGGKKGEAFVTSAEGMPPRKRARGSATSSIAS